MSDFCLANDRMLFIRKPSIDVEPERSWFDCFSRTILRIEDETHLSSSRNNICYVLSVRLWNRWEIHVSFELQYPINFLFASAFTEICLKLIFCLSILDVLLMYYSCLVVIYIKLTLLSFRQTGPKNIRFLSELLLRVSNEFLYLIFNNS